MGKLTETLTLAQQRGQALGLPYAGALTPQEAGDLLRLADAQQRTGNTAGYIVSLEKLLLNYPKKDYWNAFLSRLPRKSGFAPRFELDVLRLRLATGTLSKTEDFMEMAQLALQAGLPAEARRIADLGFKAGALGTGAEADRHKRLRELATKQEGEAKASLASLQTEGEAAKEGDLLVRVGYAWVSLGEADKGIDLIQKGIAKGNLKRPEDAKLRLGMAQLQAPKTKAAGVQTLRGVKGTEGAGEIARLWTIVGG